jgi:hypothetical protein
MKTCVKAIVVGVFATVLLPGCTWVDLKPQAEKVRVLTQQEVGRCKDLGRVTSNTLDKVGFIARPKGSVQEEIYRLARNNAANMGGDTIVPSGPLIDGEQPFRVYRCINP